MDTGILYIATGEDYIDEAKRSARQTKSVLDLPIALVCDREIDADVFDEIIIDPNPQGSYADKPRNLKRTPFEKTLFIDTDIYITKDVNELFDLLDYFQLAAAVDPNEAALRLEELEYFDDLPDSVPEYNTGVILYDESVTESRFFKSWTSNYSETHIHDQPSFRKTLAETNIQFTAISPVYNCLIEWPIQITGEVSILHDISGIVNGNSIEGIDRRINRSTNPRIFHTTRDKVVFPPSKLGDAVFRLFWNLNPIVILGRTRRTRPYELLIGFVLSLKNEGLVKTLEKTKRFIEVSREERL